MPVPSVVVTVTGWLLPVLLVGAPERPQVKTCPPQAGSQDSGPLLPARTHVLRQAVPGDPRPGTGQGDLRGACPAYGELLCC